MEMIEQRIEKAETLWRSGAQAELGQDYALAYRLYTEAHDVIMDCARLHQHAHVQLRRVNLKLGNYTELLGDWFLHFLAPLGILRWLRISPNLTALPRHCASAMPELQRFAIIGSAIFGHRHSDSRHHHAVCLSLQRRVVRGISHANHRL